MLDSKQKRLGKGLEALIPKNYLSAGRTIVHIPVDKVSPNPYQPRKYFKNEAIESLSESIKRFGLAQPILVRRKGIGYEIISGERRYKASCMAGLERIPAIVKDYTDEESLMMAIVENIEREQLNPVEVAKGYHRLIEEFSLTHDDIAKVFSRSRSAVTNSLRLLALPDDILMAVSVGDVSEGHARALLGLEDKNGQLRVFEMLKDNKWSVRQLEDYLRGQQEDEKQKKVSLEKELKDLFKKYESELKDSCETRVKISGTKKKGHIKLYYKSHKQFIDLVQKINPKS